MTIVIDTNVIVSAFKSQAGASHALVSLLPHPAFVTALSLPLYCEYQDVLNRPGMVPPQITASDKLAFCRFFASVSSLHDIYFLWRSILPDPKDDMVLELAVAAEARYIVTHNILDFAPATSFGIDAITPITLLTLAGLP